MASTLSLPDELTLRIFRLVSVLEQDADGPRADLWRERVLLCKRLQPVAETLLYEDATLETNKAIFSFCRTISARSLLGTLMLSLSLVAMPRRIDQAYSPVASMAALVHLLPKLKTLMLSHCYVHLQDLQALVAHPSLETLLFNQPRFGALELQTIHQVLATPDSALRHLYFSDWQGSRTAFNKCPIGPLYQEQEAFAQRGISEMRIESTCTRGHFRFQKQQMPRMVHTLSMRNYFPDRSPQLIHLIETFGAHLQTLNLDLSKGDNYISNLPSLELSMPQLQHITVAARHGGFAHMDLPPRLSYLCIKASYYNGRDCHLSELAWCINSQAAPWNCLAELALDITFNWLRTMDDCEAMLVELDHLAQLCSFYDICLSTNLRGRIVQAKDDILEHERQRREKEEERESNI